MQECSEPGGRAVAVGQDPVRGGDDRFRLALEAAGHAWFEFDARSGRVVGGAPWTAIGYGADELPASIDAWIGLVQADDRAALLEGLERQRRSGNATCRIECRVRARDGGYRWVLVSSRVVARDLDGEPIRVFGTMTDTTEARALHDRVLAADRLASLGALAAGMAHAVGNALESVASGARMLREELERLVADPGRLAAVLPELRQAAIDGDLAADRLRQVIHALRQLTAPSGGEPIPVDVRAELEGALALARNAVTNRARLALELAPTLPRVLARPGELSQVFVNLLVNAAEALPDGQVLEHEVRVGARVAGGRVVVEIRDTGRGIGPDEAGRVFDPFYTTRPDGGASGLGLSVCHGIVSRAGGTIEVESAPGRGTAVRVLLPPAPARHPSGAAAHAARGRVLVIDDEPLVGRSLARLLQAAHDVTVLTSAVDALARIEQGERWDAILCDVMMPELSGMDFEDRLTAAAPALLARVVYLTGGAFTDRSRAFLASGRPFLEKPVDPAVLRARVAELIRGPAGAAAAP